jgi:hypothetical protein
MSTRLHSGSRALRRLLSRPSTATSPSEGTACDLDNTSVQQANTAKADALALDKLFCKYGGSSASGITPF